MWTPLNAGQLGPALVVFFIGLLVVNLIDRSNAQLQDGRCYLRRGRSSDSFSVSELLQPGEAIGTLDVGGDPGPIGNITLTIVKVKQNSHLVDIVPGTNTLVLNGHLDKEGLDGPSSLQVNVKCEKKNSKDPAIIIPARIVVQDANDNSPNFVNTPYVIQLNEAMTPGMLVTPNIVKAFDRDQPGPFSTIEYDIQPGPHSNYLAFQSAMSSTLVLKSQLDYEKIPKFTVTIRIKDKGEPPLMNTTTLTVHIVDADDQNPKFWNQSYTAVIPETNSKGDALKILPAPIKAEDQDRGLNVPIRYTFDSETVDGNYFSINSKTGVVTLTSGLPLDMNLPITLVVRASQVDNEDRRALVTLTVSRSHLANGLHFLSPLYHLNAPENLPIDSVLLRLQTNRPFDQHLLFVLKDSFDGQFVVANAGQVILKRHLDYEAVEKLVLEVQVTSGRLVDFTKIELSILNVNEHDPKFNSPAYNFRASESGRPIGQIIAKDNDRHDRVTITITGTFANAFYLDDDGELYLKNVSVMNDTAVAHLVLVASDDGVPPRTSSASLEILIADELLNAVSTGDDQFLLNARHVVVIVFGVALGVFFFIIVILAIHIAKKKHKRERVGLDPTSLYPSHRPPNKMAGYMTDNGFSYAHQKLMATSSMTATTTTTATTTSTSTATAIESSPASSDSDNTRTNYTSGSSATLPRRTSSRVRHGSTDSSACNCHHQELSNSDDEDVTSVNCIRCIDEMKADNLLRSVVDCDHRQCYQISLMSRRRSSMKARQGFIEEKRVNGTCGGLSDVPRRVKKLSWEDEKLQKTLEEHDGDAAVLTSTSTTPYSSKLRPKALDQPDLTVYF